jgi:cytidylate kinase
MIKRKNIIKIAIDSPAAAGAGTLAKAISKHYNLFYLDTGKIYRMIAYIKIKFPKKFNQSFIKSKIKTLKVKDLDNKALLSDEVGTEASIISKVKSTRKLDSFISVKFRLQSSKKL